jgi:hypothetical protein
MIQTVEDMIDIVDRYYGDSLQRELTMLRSALEDGDAEKLEDVIGETVDGCMSAMAELDLLANHLDDLKSARDETAPPYYEISYKPRNAAVMVLANVEADSYEEAVRKLAMDHFLAQNTMIRGTPHNEDTQ